ncbi:hypothetical protein V8C40DRAFT_247580 [Trichoderma camerunense]
MGRSEQSKSRTHLQNIGALAGKREQGNESEEDAGRREKNLLIAAELSYLEWSKSARRDAALCDAMRC